jgi:hypothetical protein
VLHTRQPFAPQRQRGAQALIGQLQPQRILESLEIYSRLAIADAQAAFADAIGRFPVWACSRERLCGW